MIGSGLGPRRIPADWAATQNNLANAYNNRIRGDRLITSSRPSSMICSEGLHPEGFPEKCHDPEQLWPPPTTASGRPSG